MRSISKNIFFIILNLALLGGLIFTMFFLNDKQAEFSKTVMEIEAHLGGDAWTKNANTLARDYARDVMILEEVFIERKDIVSLIELIEQAGERLGLDVAISSLSDEIDQDATQPQSVKMVINTEGGWQGSLTFIKFLGALPYKIDLKSAGLSVSEQGVWTSDTALKVVIFPDQNG